MNAKVYFKLFLVTLMIAAFLNLSTSQVYALTATEVGIRLEDDCGISQLFLDYASNAGYTAIDWHNNSNLTGVYQAAGGWGEKLSLVWSNTHGDWDTEYDQWYKHWFFWQTCNLKVYDDQLYHHSEWGNISFVFMWTCHSADVRGWLSENPDDGSIIEQGLPGAWLNVWLWDPLIGTYAALSVDGYVNIFPSVGRFCFIGFEGSGPSLTYDFPEAEDAGYRFMLAFWQAAFDGEHTIKGALDHASQNVFKMDFGDCLFYNGFYVAGYPGWMMVYGNTAIQIAFIWDFTCDRLVDMRDIRRVAAAYLTEAPYWPDPVVDVVPDGVIDMKDIREVSSHYLEEYP
jgi:hypothetical protein